MKVPGPRTPPGLLLLAAVLVGAGVRLWFSRLSGFYLDEAQAVSIAQLPTIGQLVEFLAAHESHPPAYYLLLRGWIALFGPSDSSVIALSLGAGAALIPLSWAVANRVTTSMSDGIAAAWLVALSPTAVRYSGMARPYALLGLVVLLAFWSMTGFLRTRSLRDAVAFGTCALIMVYTHNWSWLIIGAMGLIAVAWLRYVRAPGDETVRLVSIYLVVGLFFLPWLPSLLQQVSGAGHFFVKGIVPTLGEVTWVLTGIPAGQAALIGAALTVLAVARIRASSDMPGLGREFIGVALTAILLATMLAIAFSKLTPLLISQCYAMLAPVLLVAVAVAVGAGRAPKGLARLVLLVCLAAFVGRIAVTSAWVRSDMREIGVFLGRHVAPADVVMVYPDYPAPTLSRYFRPPGEVYSDGRPGLPPVIPFDRRSARDADTSGQRSTSSLIEASARAGRRVWYVTIENPSDYPPPRHAVERAFEAHYGPPVCVFAANARPRLYEDMKVALYSPNEPVQRGPAPGCT